MYGAAYELDDERWVGQTILSRAPLRDPRALELKRFNLPFRSRHRIAVATTAETSVAPIHVYNVHLDTRINLGQRMQQLASVLRDVEALDEPVIIAGDFNTTGFIWIFHTIPLPFVGRQGAGLQRLMQDLGFRPAFGRARRRTTRWACSLTACFCETCRCRTLRVIPLKSPITTRSWCRSDPAVRRTRWRSPARPDERS